MQSVVVANNDWIIFEKIEMVSSVDEYEIRNILFGKEKYPKYTPEWRNKNDKCEAFLSCSSPAWITQEDTFSGMNKYSESWIYITLEYFYFKYCCSNYCLSIHEKNHEMTFDLRLSYNFQQCLKWLQTMFFHSYYRFIQSDNFSNSDYEIKLSINSVK